MSLNIVKRGIIIARQGLSVTGTTSLSGAVTAGSSLNVVNTSTLSGAVTAGSSLNVVNTSTLSGAVTAGSSLNVVNTSTLLGDVTTGSTLNVSGNTIIKGSLTVNGNSILSGWNVKDIIAGSNITVQNSNGNYTISSTASGGGGGTSSTTLGFDTPTFSLTSLGSAINGTQTNEFFGQEVSISSDGTVIAVGLSNTGTAKIYAWNGTSWIQRGTTFS